MINIALDTDAFKNHAGFNFIHLDDILKNNLYRIVLFPINIIEEIPNLKPNYYHKILNYFNDNKLPIVCHSWYEYADYIYNNFSSNYNFVNYSQKIKDMCNPSLDENEIKKLIEFSYGLRERLMQIGGMLLVQRKHPIYLEMVCNYYIFLDESLKKDFKEYYVKNIKKEFEDVKDNKWPDLDPKISCLVADSIKSKENSDAKRKEKNDAINNLDQICNNNKIMVKVIIQLANDLFPKLQINITSEKISKRIIKYINLPIIYMLKILLENIRKENNPKKYKGIYGTSQLEKAALGDGEFLYSFLISNTKYFITCDKTFYDCASWILCNLKQLFGTCDTAQKKVIKIEKNNICFLKQIEQIEKNLKS